MDFPPDEDYARIKIAAAGEVGDRVAARLGSLVANIECLPGGLDLEDVRSSFATADMVIIVSGLEDASAADHAAQLAATARGSERCQVTLALVTRSSVARSGPALASIAELRRTVDALFLVSPDSLIPIDGQAPGVLTVCALEEYLVRLQVGELARMITEMGLICMDFADVRAIMRNGSSAACLGIGIASGENGAGDAALKVLHSLESQQLNPETSSALLVSVTGSTNITMDDFDMASRVVHEAINEDSNVIITLLMDDALAGNVRVMIMVKGGRAEYDLGGIGLFLRDPPSLPIQK